MRQSRPLPVWPTMSSRWSLSAAATYGDTSAGK